MQNHANHWASPGTHGISWDPQFERLQCIYMLEMEGGASVSPTHTGNPIDSAVRPQASSQGSNMGEMAASSPRWLQVNTSKIQEVHAATPLYTVSWTWGGEGGLNQLDFHRAV